MMMVGQMELMPSQSSTRGSRRSTIRWSYHSTTPIVRPAWNQIHQIQKLVGRLWPVPVLPPYKYNAKIGADQLLLENTALIEITFESIFMDFRGQNCNNALGSFNLCPLGRVSSSRARLSLTGLSFQADLSVPLGSLRPTAAALRSRTRVRPEQEHARTGHQLLKKIQI